MKKSYLLIIALLAFNSLIANPVDVTEAKVLGQKFMDAPLTLAYTAFSNRGEACYYVFNDEKGFVIISADDFYRPVIGYSENGKFDVDNIPPALQDYLDNIVAVRSLNRSTSSAAPDVAADWRMLEKTGKLVSRHGGRGVDYLVQTQWNQDYPYNYFCPEDPDGSHGHTYVGCLATSMAQLVSFWKDPVHGYGSHCYYHEDYGQICADFENTYYDWDHIANKINENSPIEEIEAAALISFHCGVTIDMGYGPDGSGGASGPIPAAMHTYFNYSDAIVQLRRDDFETEVWKGMVREQFDMGWPMYYGGCDDGCHAFICDGYDDYDMFHFNLGWGGGSDGWYIIDDAPYTNPADAMFNFVPQAVYDATPSAPTNLTVNTESDTSLNALVIWTNPTTYLDGTPLTDIEKVVVMRNSKVCYETTDGIVAGQEMSFTDHVPCYDSYEYKVFVVSNGRNGKQMILRHVSFGPSCDWKVVMSTDDYNGWKGNHISIYNMANTEIAQMTITSSSPQVVHFDAPIGSLYFSWVASNDTVDNISINIKDAQNNSVFSYSGSSADLNEGVFATVNNGCGNDNPTEAPGELYATTVDDNILLTWSGSSKATYGYNIYRDGVLCYLVDTEEFIDEEASLGGHCYQICYLTDGGESPLSNEACASAGEGCESGRNLWFEIQDNGKPKITWAHPITGAADGYFVYRKVNEDGEYVYVKIVAGNKTEYKETKALQDGTWYYYRIVPYYQDIDCYSAPIKSLYNNEYFVKILYSLDGVEETMTQSITVYPNPAKDMLTVKAENLSNVVIYNSVGQKVFAQTFDSDEAVIDMSGYDTGIYMVRITADGEEVIRKVSVIK